MLALAAIGARLVFRGEDDAILSAEINDIPMALELMKKERVSAEAGREFSMWLGDERWIDDMKISFVGVADDSRCPMDVVCVQAGWVTLKFTAGEEEITLRLPGDATIPNAAVAGSYIITLVDVDPAPRSGEPQEERRYTATLRVEVHDTKG